MTDSMQSPTANGPVLECKNVVRQFAEGKSILEVLSGVNLEVKPAERLAIIGTSGSGKTTLLQIMGGLDEPTTGEVLVGGHSMAHTSEIKKGDLRNRFIGFVYQFHHLLREFSAEENVAMPLLIRRVRKDVALEKARALLERVGLGERLTHKPGELSGGEQQRVAVARALVNRPEVVMADEPTGNLDDRTTEEVHGLIRSLADEERITFIVVTHKKSFSRYADRVLTLVDGRLQEATDI